jgi:uroporphyrinogen-III synthase
VPDAFNSEALLAMPPLQALAGKRIVIFRGEGGRPLLGDTLKARGARVDYAEVYRRAKPSLDPRKLAQCWEQGEIQVVVVASNESLQNLFDIVGEVGQQWLRDTPLIVVSERAQRLAQELGFNHPPVLTTEASDEAIMETLLKWHQARFE